jgi:putative acyl-CoA dehydrogenase
MATSTHEVTNQPPPLVDWNLYEADEVLQSGVAGYGAVWAESELRELGARVGSAEVIEWGVLANQYPPELHTHDRFGHRIDEVAFHPTWHRLMDLSLSYGLHSLPWEEDRKGAHVARAALFFLAAQNELGHGCPVSMAYSVLPTLRHQPEVAAAWEPLILSRQYDRRFVPVSEKTGALVGMTLTEKQGGSDLRANTTGAEPVDGGGPGGEYRITGHKWFCSAPMCDAFLITAQAPGGLSAFLLPRWTEDGRRNRFFIQRLKDKLGNRSNASAEIELDGAFARLVGEEGRGVQTIVGMLHRTRFDCALAAAALMRQAVSQVVHHTGHRQAFGKALADQPLMRNVVADLTLESEAALALVLRLAAAFDEDGEQEAAFRRIVLSVAKYWTCKRGPLAVGEALEGLAGNGYVEESVLPRLYREAPLYGIWEGSGNVICLDVLRALRKEPESADAFVTELEDATGADPRLDQAIERVKDRLTEPDQPEEGARRLVEEMATTLQAALLVRHSVPAVADAFCASRLDGDYGSSFGTLPSQADLDGIVTRAPHPFW